jgi:hypothetical protein
MRMAGPSFPGENGKWLPLKSLKEKCYNKILNNLKPYTLTFAWLWGRAAGSG